jgi:hypothetical protein
VNVPELVIVLDVRNEVKVRRRGHDQMDGRVGNRRKAARVSENDSVRGVEGVARHHSLVDLELGGDRWFAAIEVDDPELRVRVGRGWVAWAPLEESGPRARYT